VGGRVDADRKPAGDRQARARQVRRKAARIVQAAVGGIAGADDGKLRQAQGG